MGDCYPSPNNPNVMSALFFFMQLHIFILHLIILKFTTVHQSTSPHANIIQIFEFKEGSCEKYDWDEELEPLTLTVDLTLVQITTVL